MYISVRNSHLELVNVIGSDLKLYLLEPNSPIILKIKIGLRYYITPELIIKLSEFENYLKIVNFCLFQEVFGQIHKTKKNY